MTFRSTTTSHFHKELTHQSYSQIDFVLINRPWRNAVKDYSTTDRTIIDSDHKLVTCKIDRKLAKKQAERPDRIPKYRTPTEERKREYNLQIRTIIEQDEHRGQDASFTDFAQIMLQAAQKQLTPVPREQKKPYISENTWRLIEEKYAKEVQLPHPTEEIKALQIEIRKQVKNDKEEHMKKQLEEANEQGYKWEGLKILKQKFNPRFTKFKDKDGNRIPVHEYATKAAEYLDNEQWKDETDQLPEKKTNPQPTNDGQYKFKTSIFEENELDAVLQNFASNRSPGPDEVRVELVQYLDKENRRHLLKMINETYEKGRLEESLHLATVVSIFKKGDSSLLSNYRPISLLQTFYKIVASLLKERLCAALDSWIYPTQ